MAAVWLLRAALVGMLLIAAPAGAGQPVWREFHSRSAGFRAEVPAEPRLAIEDERTLVGRVVRHHYVFEHPDARFDLERLDLPILATAFLSSRRLLERSKDGYVEELDVLVESVSEIEVQGHPGLRLVFRHRAEEGSRGETWFVLAGRHLYMVAAGPYRHEAYATLVERFFASFRICLEGEPSCEPAAEPSSD